MLMTMQFCTVFKAFVSSSVIPLLFICHHLGDQSVYKYLLLEHLQCAQPCSKEHKRSETHGLCLTESENLLGMILTNIIILDKIRMKELSQ